MAVVFERPKSLLDVPTHYCPGCTHGIVHRILLGLLKVYIHVHSSE